MTPLTPSASPSRLLSFPIALVATLIMAFAITYLDVLQPAEPALSILAFLPGLISLLALSASGLSRFDLYLRLSPLSRSGLGALAAVTILLLPILASSSGWVGWRWLPALVYAPASGIAQELFFRASLLPALERLLPGRKTLALFIHSAIFVGYHYRTFSSLPSLPFVILVAVVLFAAGCGWGWQVQKDRTVLWTIIQHSLFLILMSMFDWA